MELSEAVKTKLAAAVDLWSQENLVGRPAILGHAVFSNLSNCLLRNQKEIMDTFKISEEP